VTVVIPACNEARVIGDVIRDVFELRLASVEVLVVDDGSADDTSAAAVAAGARVVRHPYNLGNGAAVKSGLRNARGRRVVLMDGDGQHRAREIPGMLRELERYDMVVGARSFGGQAGMNRFLANKVYNGLASYVTEFRVEDLTSGFRAMRRSAVLPFLSLLPNTFSYPTTITLAFLHSGLTVKYVPIEAAPRVGKSKIRLLDDGLRFFLILTRIATLYAPLRVFLPVSAFFFFSGVGYYLYTYLSEHRFTNFGLFLLTTSIVIFMIGLVSEQISLMRMERMEPERGEEREG
jgi:glycosyltransferase involved in cell wall biosynthesis